MSFSYDRAWNDLVRMARSEWSLLLAVAAVLIFLPDFGRALFIPGPRLRGFDMATVDALNGYFSTWWLPLILASLIQRWGEATLYVLLLDASRPTVRDALQTGLRLLPVFFAVNLLATLAVLAGFVLLIVPGIYLIGRLAVAAPAMIAERRGGPVRVIERSFALTHGRGWSIAGLVLLVALVASIVVAAVSAVMTVVLSVAVPEVALPAMQALVDGALSLVSTLSMLLISAAIYRQLAR